MVLHLIEKEHLIDNIWAFRFKPGKPLDWIAGQFMRVELPHNNPDKEGTKRWFTVSSAPYEKFFQITTRITDSTFKQALSKLKKGDSLQLLEKPHGDFVWEDSKLPVVFVAGGIGVTPFHSILKQRAHDDQSLDITLVYGGRTADLPFKPELKKWSAKDSRLEVRYSIGKPLTAKKVAKLAPDLLHSLVYVSGPEPMVEALNDDLKQYGLPEDQLKGDFFPNYTEANY